MYESKSGMVLVTVLCFTAVLTVLATGLMVESGTQNRLFMRQLNLERALYAAESGSECMVGHLISDGVVPAVITGNIGQASFSTAIMDEGGLAGTTSLTYSVSGSVRLNPAEDDVRFSFQALMGDGRFITRNDLHADGNDVSGSVVYVRFRPIGAPADRRLTIDGVQTTLDPNRTYVFSGVRMNAKIWKAGNGPGNPMGLWYLDLDAEGARGDDGTGSGGNVVSYRIISIGHINDVSRALVIDGVRQQTWARYALWYNTDAYGCWFTAGEKFYGPVHANCEVNFSGDPEFFRPLTSSHDSYGGNTNHVIFHEGFNLNVHEETMADVSFPVLRNHASLILTGKTSVTMAQTNLLVSNEGHGWTNHVVPLHGLSHTLYIATDGVSTGLCSVGGVLDGRLTIVAEDDIRITNHVTYAVHPTNGSANALGLIANRNVTVASSAPNNLNIFAHIMATGRITPNDHYADGKFWVENYDSQPPKGTLTVFGGIVQDTRGPVGMFSHVHGPYSGFVKNYHFDPRFTADPPPNYPVITNRYRRTTWRDLAL